MLIHGQRRLHEKPPVSNCLNYGHPLATGLIFCMALNEYGPNWDNRSALRVVQDATGNWLISFTSSTSNLVYGVPGPGWNFPATNRFFSVADLTSTAVNSIPTDQVTCLFIRRKTDTTLRAAKHFGNSVSTLANRCGLHAPFSDGNLYFDFGGASGNNRVTVTGQSWTTQADYFAVTAGSSGLIVYRNGGEIGNNGGNVVTRSQTAGESFTINSGEGSNGDLEDIFFFAISRVEWPPSLVQWWMQEPYGMFIPQAPRINYFVPTDSSIKQTVKAFVIT